MYLFFVTCSSSFMCGHDCRCDRSRESACSCFSSNGSESTHRLVFSVLHGSCCETLGKGEGNVARAQSFFPDTQPASLNENQTQKLTLPSITCYLAKTASLASWLLHLGFILGTFSMQSRICHPHI